MTALFFQMGKMGRGIGQKFVDRSLSFFADATSITKCPTLLLGDTQHKTSASRLVGALGEMPADLGGSELQSTAPPA
jgi:hypothetical protein